MILVDVYVPSLERSFDFQLDEKSKVSNLIEEMVEMLSGEFHQSEHSDAGSFLLCSMEDRSILSKNATLNYLGIRNGSRLMLV